LAAALIVLAVHMQRARHEREDCDGIYRSIILPHHSDAGWLKSHVLLNETEGQFVKPGISDVLGRLPLQERLRLWWEFHSFAQGKHGEPLAYSHASEPRLVVISPDELPRFLASGFQVLQFSKPGFSFDHTRAVVFVGVEVPNAYPAAPYFQGSLLYFAKVGGCWVRDQHPGPSLFVVT
jgi:hypothetical protein